MKIYKAQQSVSSLEKTLTYKLCLSSLWPRWRIAGATGLEISTLWCVVPFMGTGPELGRGWELSALRGPTQIRFVSFGFEGDEEDDRQWISGW